MMDIEEQSSQITVCNHGNIQIEILYDFEFVNSRDYNTNCPHQQQGLTKLRWWIINYVYFLHGM